MNGQIFISYRREDASYPAGRLYDNLQSRFPQSEIFMDVDSIKPGIDFVQTIEERVGACDVLVAVIGKRWLSAADGEGRRRLDNPEDFVRVEVATALKRGVRVIPVLVEGAVMPPAGQLPEELKPLARRNALSLSHDRFRADAERLMDSVGEVLEAARGGGPARPPEGQQQPRRGRAPGQDHAEALPGMGTGPGAPSPNQTPPEGSTVNLTRSRRWLVVIGFGVVVVAGLLGVGLFKAARPPSVSIKGSSSPTPAPLAAASKAPSPTPLASPASPSPTPSGADWLVDVRKAAEAGNVEAMSQLGDLYNNGNGVAQDYAQAREWYQKAADSGSATAMSNLGWLYQNGWGVAQDYAQARQWYQKAADAGDSNAMSNLGYLYQYGLGVACDYAQAREWYQKAAKAGNAYAMSNLGGLYQNGLGVVRDYAQAREWYQKAAKAGNAIAKERLSQLPSK